MTRIKIPSWKEVGEQVVKNAAIVIGQELITKKVAPAASSFARKAWERVKNTKATSKEKKPEGVKGGFREAKTKNVSGTNLIVDAQFVDFKD